MQHETLQLAADLRLHRFGEESGTLLLVRGGRALMVDCHDADAADAIDAAGLPRPDAILHTHVQPEHCAQGDAFPEASVYVPRGAEELAGDPEAYRRRIDTTWDDPEAWGETRGAEPYGIAGCVTRLPPPTPLNVAGSLAAGDRVPLADLELEVVALPGHTAEAIGLVVRDGDRPVAVFVGDLLRHPGALVNFYDLESGYAVTRLPELPDTLRRVAGIGADVLIPATGPPIHDGPAAARGLARRIEAYLDTLRTPPAPSPDRATVEPRRRVAGFHELLPGVYQNESMGNVIVLVDERGRGLVVDPGPCAFGQSDAGDRFVESLDRLAEATDPPMRCVDTVLITHFHGDHIDMVPRLRERHPGLCVVTWERVADVIERPESFPYACRLPWYGLGVERVAVDRRVGLGATLSWHGTPIEVLHLPGHCYVHAGFLLDFRGKRLAITGDTLQMRGTPTELSFIMCNHAAPDAEAGPEKAFRQLLGRGVELNIGGHGSRFADCEAIYRASLASIERSQAAFRELFVERDLQRVCVRPWFAKV